MATSTPLLILLDLAALSVLVFGLYFRRYRRRDMVVAIAGINIGVVVVATALSSTDVTAGLGLGLFGVLSIIRLRSSELSQEEVAYYFSALALGLLAGFQIEPGWLTPALMATVLVVLYVVDHPSLFADHRHQTLQLGAAFIDESTLIAHLEHTLNAQIMRAKVTKVDFVNDTTLVDVRYRMCPNQPVMSAGSQSMNSRTNNAIATDVSS